MLAYLQRLAGYNLWANSRLADYFLEAPEMTLARKVSGSFPSVRETALHIWGAENVWYHRLHGESPTKFLADATETGATEAFAGLLDQSRTLQQYTLEMTSGQLDEVVAYRLFAGVEMRNSRAEMLQHCFNHSTYHRGQLVMFGRQLEIGTPPATDLIRFFRQHPSA